MEKNQKILFCHIPKCSGTNVHFQLNQKYKTNYKWYIHRTLQYEIHNYEDYYKFTVIRDPLEKLISYYFYTRNVIDRLINSKTLDTYQSGELKQLSGEWKQLSDLYIKYNMTDIYSYLNNFKTMYNNEIIPYLLNLKDVNKNNDMQFLYVVGFFPQYTFCCDDDFNILVDDVINIKDVDDFLLNKFGIINNTKKNTHKDSNTDYSQFLNKQNIIDIQEIYKEDYKYLFNNQFTYPELKP